jgi:hypothetical protein
LAGTDSAVGRWGLDGDCGGGQKRAHGALASAQHVQWGGRVAESRPAHLRSVIKHHDTPRAKNVEEAILEQDAIRRLSRNRITWLQRAGEASAGAMTGPQREECLRHACRRNDLPITPGDPAFGDYLVQNRQKSEVDVHPKCHLLFHPARPNDLRRSWPLRKIRNARRLKSGARGRAIERVKHRRSLFRHNRSGHSTSSLAKREKHDPNRQR